MRHIVMVSAVLIVLGGCDITDPDATKGTETYESPVLTFQPVEQTSEPPGTSVSQPSGGVSIPSGSPSVSVEEIDSEGGESTTNSGQVSVSPRGTTDDFQNEGSGIEASFWTCSTADGRRSFRYKFSKRYSSTQRDTGLLTMRAAEDSIGEQIEVGGESEFYPSYQSWRIDTADIIELSPKDERYDPQNYTWTLERFNTARTRVAVQDSRGFSLSCARIMESIAPQCRFDYYYPGCSLPAEDPDNGQGDAPIKVLWEFASTEKFINSRKLDTATNYWACDRSGGLEPFRMKVGGLERDGSVRILEGATGDAQREDHDWRTDTVGNVNFVSNYTKQETVLWTLFDFNFADNGQTFQASDTKGFDLSCQRKSESPDFSQWDPETSCFNVPKRCDEE